MRSISVQIARTGQALLLAAWLCACGGGGGGASDLPPPAPPPDPGPVGSVRASAASLVAAGCTGGRTGGTLFAEAEVEPFVAISPTNPNHLVGTWQQDRASDGTFLNN